jgi:alpha-L-fucosidase
MKCSQQIFYLPIIFLFLLITACGTENDNSTRYYWFTHESDDIDYTFVAKTSNSEVIAKVEQELQKPFDERNMHINGPIDRGTKDYNSNWSWHFVENQWNLAEISAEVCDGRPSFVEEELDYWVDQVGRFCPWSSRVEAEINP